MLGRSAGLTAPTVRPDPDAGRNGLVAKREDVGTKSVKDAAAPMSIDWLTSSYVRLRLRDPTAE
jgi:hypothetical protein